MQDTKCCNHWAVVGWLAPAIKPVELRGRVKVTLAVTVFVGEQDADELARVRVNHSHGDMRAILRAATLSDAVLVRVEVAVILFDVERFESAPHVGRCPVAEWRIWIGQQTWIEEA